jgi:hypothetical protein
MYYVKRESGIDYKKPHTDNKIESPNPEKSLGPQRLGKMRGVERADLAQGTMFLFVMP